MEPHTDMGQPKHIARILLRLLLGLVLGSFVAETAFYAIADDTAVMQLFFAATASAALAAVALLLLRRKKWGDSLAASVTILGLVAYPVASFRLCYSGGILGGGGCERLTDAGHEAFFLAVALSLLMGGLQLLLTRRALRVILGIILSLSSLVLLLNSILGIKHLLWKYFGLFGP